MIEIKKPEETYPKLKSVPIGTIFSWPVHLPKSKRAYAIKAQKGIFWIHSVLGGAEFFCDEVFNTNTQMEIEIESQILIKDNEETDND